MVAQACVRDMELLASRCHAFPVPACAPEAAVTNSAMVWAALTMLGASDLQCAAGCKSELPCGSCVGQRGDKERSD